MLAGHVGAALALKRADRRMNLGVLVLAALLPDVLLWMLVLAGREQVVVPGDFAARHYLGFVFPYSHGLPATLAWAALGGTAAALLVAGEPARRRLAGLVVAGAVLSHFLLDVLVHVPELPIAGAASAKLGLGLWTRMPLALAVEAALTAGGLALCLAGGGYPRGRAVRLSVFAGAILAFTIVGMTLAPAPPATRQLAATSLGLNGLLILVGFWLN